MTAQPKPSLERGRTTRYRLGSDLMDNETRLMDKTDGEGHGARKKDIGKGLRKQHGSKDTAGEACTGCMRMFKSTRGVKQHQRLTKCLEESQVDRIYKSKAAGIQEQHHSDTSSRLPVIRPLATSGGAKPLDDNLQDSETSLHQVEKLEKADPNRLEERKEQQDQVKPLNVVPSSKAEINLGIKPKQLEDEHLSAQEVEEINEPVEEFSLLPGITVKTYVQKEVTRYKGSRFYREFRNSSHKKNRASDQGDIRKWVKEKPKTPPEESRQGELSIVETFKDNEEKEENLTVIPTELEGNLNCQEANKGQAVEEKQTQPVKPKMKSVVVKVNNTTFCKRQAEDKPGIGNCGKSGQEFAGKPNKPHFSQREFNTEEHSEIRVQTGLQGNKQTETRKVEWVFEPKNSKDNGHDKERVVEVTEVKDSRTVIIKQTDLRTWLDQSKEKDARTNRPKQENLDRRVVVNNEIKEEPQNSSEGRSEIKTLIHNINTGPSNDILSKNNHLEMKRCDYRSLTGRNYLNDKVIDEYMFLIKERNQQEENLPDIGILSVHMFKLLDENFETGYERTRNWIKEDLTLKDMILVPIHRLSHWTLVAVDMKKLTISYYDSILGSRRTSNAPKIIKKHLEKYCREMGKEKSFTIKIKEDAPLQRDGVNCGVFVCQNAEKIARGVHVNTRQEDMNKARLTMMLEIFNGKLSAAEMEHVTEFIKLSGKNKGKSRKEKTTKPAKKIRRKEVDTKDKTGRMRIDWPPANSKEWDSFETDVAALLSYLDGPPLKRAIQHPKIIYEMGKERFGYKNIEKKPNQPSGPSRRQRHCLQLRQDINNLKRAYYEAPQDEKKAIQELQQEKLKQLRLSKRAETLRKNRRKLTKNSSSFLRQPFQFAREVINPKPKGNLESSKEEVETFLENAHNDPGRNEPLPSLDTLWEFSEPEIPLKDNPPTLREFTEKLKKTRSKSAPGPNGVPYLVYKRCPEIAKIMFNYLRGLWVRNQISEAWKEAEGVLIPKEDGATDIGKFRTISLLNVEGKLFFSFKAKRLLDFTLANKYIDTTIQKGGIPGVSGCLEHTALLSQLIQEAKAEKKNLVVTWLDISNAYGSIPHKLIGKALEAAHVSKEMIDLIGNYYENPKIRFATKHFTTDWQKLEKGIITGCTLSVVLFTLTMTWLVVSAKRETKGPKSTSGQQQENSRLFMDDLNTTTETVVQTRYLLQKLQIIFDWAGLDFKQEKCRALVIIKGIVERRDIILNGKPITLLQDNPAKYLGKSYNDSLTEQEQIKQLERAVKQALKNIELCRLPGRYKSWMVQNMLLKRIMWPLSIYNVPYTKVEEMQRWITAKLKKWLGLPKNLTVDAMYSRSSKLQLPFTSLVEEVKVTKARNLVSFQDSKDPCIRNANIEVDRGRKANTKLDVKDAKERLRMKDIAGIANRGREGLGMSKRQYFCKSNQRDQRTLITEEIRKKEEESREVRMITLAKQGASTRWEVPERSISQWDLMKTSDASFKFLVKSVYDLLPTPSNKNTWFGTEEKCALCGQEGTLNHILSGCKVALAQGRYKWRHDQVLRTIANAIEEKRKSKNCSVNQAKPRINFLRTGEKPNKRDMSQKQDNSYLDSANDWKLEVDLNGRLKVPAEVTITNLRPDMMLISWQTKQVSFIELTVPSEERIEVSGEIKKTKYEAIAIDGRQKGWRVRIWAVEVGCRGFPASSMASFLKEVGYRGKEGKRVIEEICHTAEMASHSIWKWSQIKNWGSQ